MVITQLIGGLGNQLFQYAAARSIAVHRKTQMKIDVSAFREYRWHAYSLEPLSIEAEVASADEVQAAKATTVMRRVLAKFGRASQFTETTLRPYNPGILNTSKNVYLTGYWQSERYFANVKDLIRREFAVRVPPDDANAAIANEIRNSESVSVHVRRGNYVSNASVNSFHGTCGLEYYRRCVATIVGRVEQPRFFVFSDDPEWARANLELPPRSVYVTGNDAPRDYEDLRLMSLCHHNILANSTFSWWGAWLGTFPGKIVLAPHKWVNDPSVDTVDLLPPSWLRL